MKTVQGLIDAIWPAVVSGVMILLTWAGLCSLTWNRRMES